MRRAGEVVGLDVGDALQLAERAVGVALLPQHRAEHVAHLEVPGPEPERAHRELDRLVAVLGVVVHLHEERERTRSSRVGGRARS